MKVNSITSVALLALAIGATAIGMNTTFHSDPNSDSQQEGFQEVGWKQSDAFARVELTTHEGKQVRFYEDIACNKKICVNFMYTICKGICPGMTANIKKVRQELADRGITDYVFVSISIEPDKDTPEQMTRYMENNGIENHPGISPWIFLTGGIEDIDRLRKSMGVYDPDPLIDADRTQHGGTLTFGNDKTNWWCATPALQKPQHTVEVLLRITKDDQRRRPSFIDAQKDLVRTEKQDPSLISGTIEHEGSCNLDQDIE